MTGEAQPDRLGAVVRAILDLRLLAVTVTLVYLPSSTLSPAGMVFALVVSIVCSLCPLLLWTRISDSVLRHPTWLAVDLVLGIAVLALAGPESPFFIATLGTAALAGIVYGTTGAAVFSVLLLVGWWAVLALRPEGADALSSLASHVTLPALYVLCAAGGAAVRRLLDTQQLTERRLVDAERANSIAAERARMAREMHDSVGKSLQGIALSASALAIRAGRDPEHAIDAARTLARSARVAAEEARELIGDLRADDLAVGLHDALEEVVRSWSQASGVRPVLDIHPVRAGTDVRYEALAIAKEALRNVEHHADATSVRVGLREADGQVRLEIIDDGRGLPADHDADALVVAGHFGLLGMRERAQRIGGSLAIGPGEAGGTALIAMLPAAEPPASPASEQSSQRARRRWRARPKGEIGREVQELSG